MHICIVNYEWYHNLCMLFTAVSAQLRSSGIVTLFQSTANTAQLSIRFTNYNSFTGGAQNFTVDVGIYVDFSTLTHGAYVYIYTYVNFTFTIKRHCTHMIRAPNIHTHAHTHTQHTCML